MTWDDLQTGLPTLFADLLGIDCQFRTQPVRVIQGPSATIDVLSVVGRGIDDREWTDLDADGDPTEDSELAESVQETVHGLRELTLQVSVWSRDQRLGESARFYLDRLRTRLRWSATIDSLKALGLALITIGPTVQIDPNQDGRAVSMASIDIRFGYGASESAEAIPFIELARVKSESLNDAAGDPVGSSMQVDLNPPEP